MYQIIDMILYDLISRIDMWGILYIMYDGGIKK